MSAVATHFTNLKMGAAATVIAAAAVLTPAAIAQARPDIMPASPVTNMLSTDMFGTDPILGPVTFSLETPWWWLGDGPNPNAAITTLATPTTIFEFSPLSLFPGFLQPIAGWFLGFIPHFSICFAGLGVSVGPYGTVSVKTGAC
jgi:hypothetical protein